MKSGKNCKKKISKKAKQEIPGGDDTFLNLMNNIGVDRLQSEKNRGKTKPPATKDNEPIDFDDSFDWHQELVNIPTSGKFSGLKKTTRRKTSQKFRITRNFVPDDILDLHGETKNDALSRVQNSIQISESGNYQALLIITGKGINSKEKGGVLGKAVWDWLKHYQVDHPIRFQWAPPFLGGKGAILVFF